MNKVLKGLGTFASRLKPQLVLEAARRLLNSPAALALSAALRSRIEDALRQGAIETLLDLLRQLRSKSHTDAKESTK